MQYLFCDVEASGLFKPDPITGKYPQADAPGQPRVAQIGMIFVGGDAAIQSQHEFTIKPRGWQMSPEAIASTGLTNEYLAEHGGPIDEALDLYARAIEGRRIVVGWNVKNYDMKCMRAELRIAGKDDLFMQTRSMDLMHPCRPIVKALDKNGRVKQPKLEEACAHFKIDHGGHRALADAMCTYLIWLELNKLRIVAEVGDPYSPKPPKRAKKGTTRHVKGTEEEEVAGGDEGFNLEVSVQDAPARE